MIEAVSRRDFLCAVSAAACAAALPPRAATAGSARSTRPNIIVMFADDISAREFPAYGASEWDVPVWAKDKTNRANPAYRAQTPVLDQLAAEGAVFRTAWANAVCSPSRATLMTGRYAHLHKWWQNSDIGTYVDDAGKRVAWPLYKSSPHMIGHVAKQAGYATFWAGKTQMKNSDLREFGFDSVLTSPAVDLGKGGKGGVNTQTDFRLERVRDKTVDPGNNKRLPKKVYVNVDSGKETVAVWPEQSFFWQPSMGLINWPPGTKNMEFWPRSQDEKKQFGVETYGPDVEMDFILEFMDRAHAQDKPFFVYHTPHLGHAARNWLGRPGKVRYPGTPKITWDGEKYIRTQPKITGDKGVYDTHGTVTEPGIHHHINYLDYQVWQVMQKLEALGIKDNTLFIFTADNGTLGYGKMQRVKDRGPRVPFYISMPGMTKHGMLGALCDVTDILPTIADVAGVALPPDYAINGTSLVPYLTTDKRTHRDWIYSFLFEKQMIRGHKVMRDLNGSWWDVSREPADMDSYPRIDNWDSVSQSHRDERDKLSAVLPGFDLHGTEHDAPMAKDTVR